MTRIFDKTDKGREEIATRKYHLASRLRTLLVLVDGKHGEGELLKQVAGLGLNEQSLAELLDNGFIAVHEAAAIAAPVAPATPRAAATVAAEALPVAAATETALLEPPPAASESAAPHAFLPPGENQYQALYNFYTSTIKSTIGLRGYGLQLKVERAGSVDDFRELRQAYLEAVLKAKGVEMARSLRDRLDQLLYLGQPPANLDPLF